MTVAELIKELQEYNPDVPVILHAQDTLDYGKTYTVTEAARYTEPHIWSGSPAVYITDGSWP